MAEKTRREKIRNGIALFIRAQRAGAGFSLIEILVVIAIVGVLASIIFASLNSARQKGRNAKRIADLYELRQAVELYLTANSRLPGSVGPGNCGDADGCNSTEAQPWIPGLTDEYISFVSVDPLNTASFRYRYRSSGGDSYELDAPIEGEGQRAENDSGNANTCPSATTCRYEIGSNSALLGDGP